MSRNPYIVAGQEPTLRESVFSFMDILGYIDLIHQSQKAGLQQETLRNLHGALAAARHVLEDLDISDYLIKLGGKDLYALGVR